MTTDVSEVSSPLIFTDAAAKKVKELIEEENNPNLMLRVFISGGDAPDFSTGLPSMKTSTKGIRRLRMAV